MPSPIRREGVGRIKRRRPCCVIRADLEVDSRAGKKFLKDDMRLVQRGKKRKHAAGVGPIYKGRRGKRDTDLELPSTEVVLPLEVSAQRSKMKYSLIAAALLCCFAVCCAQQPDMPPPAWTWYRYGEVGGNYFRVRWLPVRGAYSYNLDLYKGNESQEYVGSYNNVHGTSYVIGGVEPTTVYGVRVQCVGDDGHHSRFGRIARVMTFGKSKSTTTTSPPPTAPTPIGSCGIGFFTCETNDECIDESWWCDYNKDCEDGTDERNCPGHCDEITEFSKHGNFTCKRWNSPGSYCFFQCNGDYARDGPHYFKCKNGKWLLPTPTCRLAKPTNVNVLVNDLSSDADITILFDNLASAVDYKLSSLIDVDANISVQARVNWELDGSRVKAEVTDLEPDRNYRVTVAYVDEDDVDGIPTRPIRFRTRP